MLGVAKKLLGVLFSIGARPHKDRVDSSINAVPASQRASALPRPRVPPNNHLPAPIDTSQDMARTILPFPVRFRFLRSLTEEPCMTARIAFSLQVTRRRHPAYLRTIFLVRLPQRSFSIEKLP